MNLTNKTLCILDINHLPKSLLDCPQVFWNKAFNIDKKSFSITEILESNSDKLKSKYLKLIHDLGKSKINGVTILDFLKIRNNISFWWMTLLVEKSNWAKSPEITNIIKLMALELFLDENNFNKIYVQSRNKKLINALKLLCQERKFDFKIIKQNNRVKDVLALEFSSSFFHFFKGLVWLLREILFSIPFALLGHTRWRSSSPDNIFISYLSKAEVECANFKEFNTNFWGPLPNYLVKKNMSSNWLYLPSRNFNFFSTYKAFKNLKENKNDSNIYSSLSSFFKWSVLKKIIKDIFFILTKGCKIKESLKKDSHIYWPLIQEDVNRSLFGIEMFSSIYYLCLFEYIAEITPKKPKIIYLAENQPWEMGLIASFKNKENILIGFAHSTIRYWDLRYFNDSKCYKSDDSGFIPRPNYLAVNGVNDMSLMLQSGYPDKDIIEVESLRYLYLNDLVNRDSISRNKVLLVLGDFLRADTMFILSFLKSLEIQECLDGVEVVFKPHPSCHLKSNDLDGINARIEHNKIGDLILQADLVFTGNVSSVAAEAYSLGKKVITARNYKDLDMSPLRGFDDVKFVSDHQSFKSCLKELLHDTNKAKKLQFFQLNSNMDNWKKLLDT
tara:strand:+ start:6426 stop:8267 length:1842 start_codon:yes stop_codon:yes gene_type:complete